MEDKKTLLIMGGSMGHGDLENIIEDLDGIDIDFQIISVCGSNKSLKKKIDNMIIKKGIYNFGFVDNVDLLMDASDLIITKPGGLTSSESLAKGIPMILINPIPGQEERNVEFLVNNGLGIMASETYPVDEAIYQLINNKDRIESIKKMAAVFGKPKATPDLCKFILNLF